MNGPRTCEIDVESGGFLKHKEKSEIEENEKAILKGELHDPVGYGWMFSILRGNTESRGDPL